jgi:hypothetical protein
MKYITMTVVVVALLLYCIVLWTTRRRGESHLWQPLQIIATGYIAIGSLVELLDDKGMAYVLIRCL